LDSTYSDDPISRRRLLRDGAAGALSLSAIAYLAACEGGGELQTKVIPKGRISSGLYLATWPRYSRSAIYGRAVLADFMRTYGTTIELVGEITDDERFFRAVRQQYALGRSGGRDLHVVADWMAARMKRLGYVQKLDRSQLPHVQRNLVDRLKRPAFGDDRDYSVPWQSGHTGIVYRKDKVKRTPSSVNELFDPAYKGKVTMLTEMRDTVGLVMLGMGEDPQAFSGVDPALRAIHKIHRAARSGQIRRFTSDQYRRQLANGDSWIALGWSGDALQLAADNPNIAFSHPDEGFMLWTDEMQVPVGAPHAFTAEKLIDFVYRPEIQRQLTRAVRYMPPVKGVRALVEKEDPKLAHDPLVFPSEQLLKRARTFRQLKPDEERRINVTFQKLIAPGLRRSRRADAGV
jgi:spermidine/putrescine transport system substrate-binding protein